MATTSLTIYNGILDFIGETALANISEDRNARYVLDRIWNNGLVKLCLEQGLWRFAMKAIKLDYDISITPIGYRYGIAKPADYVRTAEIASDPQFYCPLEYSDQGPWIYCDYQSIYLRYVSNNATGFGGDYTIWPSTFLDYVHAEGGLKACKPVTGKDPSEEQMKAHMRLKLSALAKDSMNDETRRTPMGTWARSRRGGKRRVGISELPGVDG